MKKILDGPLEGDDKMVYGGVVFQAPGSTPVLDPLTDAVEAYVARDMAAFFRMLALACATREDFVKVLKLLGLDKC